MVRKVNDATETNGQKRSWQVKASIENSHLNIATTQAKPSDPNLKPCWTVRFLGEEFMLILLFLTGKNEIFNVKDKTQTQLQSLQQLHTPTTQPISTYFTHYHPLCQSKCEIWAMSEMQERLYENHPSHPI